MAKKIAIDEQVAAPARDCTNNIDWKKVRKAYKALKIPNHFYNPCASPLEKAAWFVNCSERSTGKTTGWLIVSLICYWMFGTVTQYVRSRADMIAPKNSGGLFDTIKACGYIEMITDGQYNSITYKSKKWYLCRVDADGNLIAMDNSNCFFMCSIDKAGDLKSSYVCPYGDLIIFDEFVDSKLIYKPNEFVFFCDLVKTIFRDRTTGKIVLLANTIDKYSQYFHELEIFERISEMNLGDSCLHTTDKGTNIYIELVGIAPVLKQTKKKFNKMFLGFKNEMLSGMTGESTWSIRNYQHIPAETEDDEKIEILFGKMYIEHNNKIVRLDIVQHPVLGTCLYAHWATRTYEDSMIFTLQEMYDPRYIYGLGEGTTAGKFIHAMLQRHKVYYPANDVGSFVENYLIQCGITTRRLV